MLLLSQSCCSIFFVLFCFASFEYPMCTFELSFCFGTFHFFSSPDPSPECVWSAFRSDWNFHCFHCLVCNAHTHTHYVYGCNISKFARDLTMTILNSGSWWWWCWSNIQGHPYIFEWMVVSKRTSTIHLVIIIIIIKAKIRCSFERRG